MVVCYTNHALDQFLEGIIPFCRDIVRIGGSSKNKVLSTVFNLSFSKYDQKDRSTRISLAECYESLESVRKRIFKLENELNLMKSNKRIVHREIRDSIIRFSEHQFRSLAKKSDIVEWLGYKETIIRKTELEDKSSNQSKTGVVESLRNAFGKLVIEADEEEISHIQNMRDTTNDETIAELDKTDETPVNESDVEFIYERIEDDGFQLQKHEKKRMRRDIKFEFKKKDRMTEEEAKSVTDVWTLAHDDRWRLYRFWLFLHKNKIMDQINAERTDYSDYSKELRMLRNDCDVAAIRGKKIIGMTTTGAAKYRHILEQLQPQIMSKLD